MVEIVLASTNRGKLKELVTLLQYVPVTLRSQSEFDVPEALEDGLSFIDNAILKARNAALHADRPALADDSGIAVEGLDGAPGIYSARYAGAQASDVENLNKLLTDTENLSESQRRCRFICVAAFVRHARDPMPIVCQGVWRGHLLRQPRGQGGFGYDPIFLIDELKLTSAELSGELKNTLSHRALALRQMVEELRAEFGTGAG